MKTELRSGRLIGYIFAIPCSAVALFSFSQSSAHAGAGLIEALFGIGALLGVHLLVNPRILARRNDGYLELYSGALFLNKKQIEVNLLEIEGFEVRTITDGSGTCWLLSLYMQVPQTINRDAQRWIDAQVPKRIRDRTDDTTIHWSLSWPEGGVKGAKAKIETLIKCHN